MIKKEVQQKLYTEPKVNVNGNIQFAITYEEETIRQQSFECMENPKRKRTQMQKDGDPQRNAFVAEEFSPHNI